MKELIKKIIVDGMYTLAGIIPKNKNLWLFGAWEGRIYADNSKYMFEYVNKNCPKIRAVWLTRNKNVVNEVRKNKYECYHMFSLKGIWFSLRANVAFETEGNWDTSPFVNREKSKVIQLWHGIAGKAAGWKDENGNPMYDKESQRIMSSFWWMGTSQKYIDVFSHYYGIPRERFYLTGYPRNDTFVTKPHNMYIESLMSKHLGCKWIIYMPTHRNFGKESISSIEEFMYVDEMLRKENVYMVYKPHFHELKNVLSYEDKFTNIILAKEQEKFADVYSYIHYFDLLISDYSSIVYDFLCSNKPIVLFTYDIEKYRKTDAGLMDYYESIPAGPFTYTWKETLEKSFELLTNDTWVEKRCICRNLFHPYDDGNNCKRVYEAVIKLCN